MADSKILADDAYQTLIFVYGTLKQGFPNYPLLQCLIDQNDAVYRGTYITHQAYPLVIGPNGIPFLINLPGEGHRVKGELFSVTTRGLPKLDDLEGTNRGHYERLPIRATTVQNESSNGEDGVVLVEAEAYYANRSFGERLWKKKVRVGLSEYSGSDSKEYARKENRPVGSSFLNDIELLLSDS